MPQISKELIKDVLATLDTYGCGAHHPDLLPLLDRPEVEPVAWISDDHFWKIRHEMESHVSDYPDDFIQPLYTHSEPFTPITADMVALDDDEWEELWIECSDPDGGNDDIEMSKFAEKVQHTFCAKNNLNLGAKK